MTRNSLCRPCRPAGSRSRLAGWVLLVLFLALMVTVPFARVPLDNTEVLLPAYATAVLMSELITSALLFVLFSIQRSRALLVLAVGYLFTALMIVPWVLTFPGVFGTVGPARRRASGYGLYRGGPARGISAFRAGLCGAEVSVRRGYARSGA